MYQVNISTNKDSFVEKHMSHWAKQAAENGSLLRLKKRNQESNDKYIELLDRDGVVLQTAFFRPHDQLCFTKAEPHILFSLADYLHKNDFVIPGLFAPRPASTDFASSYSRLSGFSHRIVKSLAHFELTKVVPVKNIPGVFRKATSDDRQKLIEHRALAQDEENTQRRFDPEKVVDEGLKMEEFFVWEQEEVIASAAIRKERTAVCDEIVGVYTAQDKRNKGVASILVQRLCERILSSGKEVCFLSADIESPHANRVYQKVGFIEKCIMDNIRFDIP